MTARTVVLRRATADVPYGFTLRHLVVYPPIVDDDKTAPVQTALVSHVEPGTAAARAGMLAGERILVVDGVAVTRLSYVEIVRLIAESGRQLQLMIVAGFLSEQQSSPSPSLVDSDRRRHDVKQNGRINALLDEMQQPQQQQYSMVNNQHNGILRPAVSQDNFSSTIDQQQLKRIRYPAAFSSQQSIPTTTINAVESARSRSSLVASSNNNWQRPRVRALATLNNGCSNSSMMTSSINENGDDDDGQYYRRVQQRPISVGYLVSTSSSSTDIVRMRNDDGGIIDNSGKGMKLMDGVAIGDERHERRFASNDWDRRLLNESQAVADDNANFRLPIRCSARQASFMAAVSAGPDITNSSSDSSIPTRTSRHRCSSSDTNDTRISYDRRLPSSADVSPNTSTTTGNHNKSFGHIERNSSNTRPKSYVMATAVTAVDNSLPTAERITERKAVTAAFTQALAKAMAPPSTFNRAPHPPSTHRIQQFITLFSNNESVTTTNSKKSLPTPALVVTDSHQDDTTTSKTPISTSIPVYERDVLKQGQLAHRQVALGGQQQQHHHRSLLHHHDESDRWQQRWAVLHNTTLNLCKQLSSFVDANGDKILNVPSDSLTIDVDEAIVDIVYCDRRYGDIASTSQHQHVLRIITQLRTEHLLAASSGDEMLKWIDELQKANRSSSSSNNQQNDRTSKLIMHRYKAKSSQITSPTAMKRIAKPVIDTTPPSPSSYSILFDTTTQPTHVASSSQNQSNGQCDLTPKSARRWKKNKSTGGKSKSDRPVLGTESSVLGRCIAECTTSGEEGDLVPLLIQLCVKVVEAHGIDTIGIYRIPGNTAAVNALKENLNHGFENVDFSDPRWKDVNVVSSLLKMFLRKLPEPLLTDKLYPFFIDANRISGHVARLKKLRHLLRKLPRAHYATLKYLVGHLHAVVAHSHINKMETRNLALMFGPSIVRPSDDNMATMVTHMSDQCKIIESLINQYDWLFNDDGDDEPPPERIDLTVTCDQSHMATSFSDMQDLLRRVNQAEEDVDRSRDNIVRSILNVRRNSRKDKQQVKSTSVATVKQPPPQKTRASSSDKKRSGKSFDSKNARSMYVDASFSGDYQERDIDAEIATRLNSASCERSTGSTITTTDDNSPSISSIGSLTAVTSAPAAGAPSSPDAIRNCWPYRSLQQQQQQQPTNELETAVTEMRRRRQANIYSARRIFISGSDEDRNGRGATDEPHHADLDDMANHTRHLNAAGAHPMLLDVVSPEAKEKIRRMQHDMQKRRLSTARNTTTTTAAAAVTTDSPRLAQHRSNDDATSIASDYSTTTTTSSSIPVDVVGDYKLLPPIIEPVDSSSTTTTKPHAAWYENNGDDVAEGSSTTIDGCCADAGDKASGNANSSRIGQKIRFRNRQQTNTDRRIDGGSDLRRRHTLSDVDQVREALENHRSSISGAAAGGEQRRGGVGGVVRRMSVGGKLTRWLKSNFRRSSPDLLVTTTDSRPFHDEKKMLKIHGSDQI